jgi:glycosyltransferase involved in cell wall biosynthesis
MKSHKPRIYFDITDLMEYGRYNSTLSGIQRVSVMLINKIVTVHGPDGLRLIAFHPLKKVVCTYSSDLFAGDFIYDQAMFCNTFDLPMEDGNDFDKHSTFGRHNLGEYITNKYGRGIKATLHKHRLAIGNRISSGYTFSRRGIVTSIETSANVLRTGGVTRQIEKAPDLTVGDVVFVPGATWNFGAYLAFLAEAVTHGVKVVQFIHDLIPLVAPEHVVNDVPEQFSQWLVAMSQTATSFIANSNATRSDLGLFFQRSGIQEKPCTVVRLAHEFVPAPKPDSKWRMPLFLKSDDESNCQIHARIYNAARLPFVLCAGTIESRKNVWTLARVWLSIVDELKDAAPRLVFAGKNGWLKDDFDDLLRGSGNGRGFIRIVERPNDNELEYLYKRSLFSICISYYEGWGLPIGESLWFGKPVLASNTSSMPEVGGELVDYADPYSFAQIREKALKLVVDAPYRTRRAEEIRNSKLRQWDEVADELWCNLKREIAASERR